MDTYAPSPDEMEATRKEKEAIIDTCIKEIVAANAPEEVI